MQRRSALHTTFFALTGLGIASGAFGCATREAEAKPMAEEPAIAVPISEVVARDVPKNLVLTGTLVAGRQADIAADVVGRVVGTYAERGERVERGKPIVRLDASTAALNRAEAVAQVESARVEQARAKLDCERAEKLVLGNVIARAEYERLRATCDGARFTTAAASARASLASKSVGDANVRAPFSGVIVERAVTVGEYVRPGMRVATLVDLDTLRLEISVPENAIAQVREGQAVSFEVGAFPNRIFSANVRYVGPALRRAGRDLVIEAEVANTDGQLRPGMFATARIAIGSAKKPVVAASALSGQGRSRRVFVVQNKRLEERVVLVGEPAHDGFSVLSGLSSGERVAGRVGADVKDGARIR